MVKKGETIFGRFLCVLYKKIMYKTHKNRQFLVSRFGGGEGGSVRLVFGEYTGYDFQGYNNLWVYQTNGHYLLRWVAKDGFQIHKLF